MINLGNMVYLCLYVSVCELFILSYLKKIYKSGQPVSCPDLTELSCSDLHCH